MLKSDIKMFGIMFLTLVILLSILAFIVWVTGIDPPAEFMSLLGYLIGAASIFTGFYVMEKI